MHSCNLKICILPCPWPKIMHFIIWWKHQKYYSCPFLPHVVLSALFNEDRAKPFARDRHRDRFTGQPQIKTHTTDRQKDGRQRESEITEVWAHSCEVTSRKNILISFLNGTLMHHCCWHKFKLTVFNRQQFIFSNKCKRAC